MRQAGLEHVFATGDVAFAQLDDDGRHALMSCQHTMTWDAVFTEGWNREMQFASDRAKALKRMIDTQLIYPPPANRAEALALANPNREAVA